MCFVLIRKIVYLLLWALYINWFFEILRLWGSFGTGVIFSSLNFNSRTGLAFWGHGRVIFWHEEVGCNRGETGIGCLDSNPSSAFPVCVWPWANQIIYTLESSGAQTLASLFKHGVLGPSPESDSTGPVGPKNLPNEFPGDGNTIGPGPHFEKLTINSTCSHLWNGDNGVYLIKVWRQNFKWIFLPMCAHLTIWPPVCLVLKVYHSHLLLGL